jgi:hypothetical protein
LTDPKIGSDGAPADQLPHRQGAMRRLERAGAVAVGLSAGGAGAYTVFQGTNQAGSAALVLVGAAFLLIGIQGTRLIRLGSAGTTIELAEREVASRLIERAEREKDPEIAEGIAEAASIVSPSVARSPILEARTYELEVRRAIKRVGMIPVPLPANAGIDFEVTNHTGRRAFIEAKHRRYGPLLTKDVDLVAGRATRMLPDDDNSGVLIVTNAPLSGSLQELNAQQRPAGRVIELITWNDERDDELLARALDRVSR